MDPARQIATLVPLIQQITKLSWTNFIDTHSRWAEEVSSLCALAGAGVYASLQVASSHMYVNDSSNMHKVKNTKKRKSEKNKQRKETFSEDDDNVARAIIILCMDRDIRDRFAKFMKVATTAKKLFNGIAILKEAVAEGHARERQAGGYINEAVLQNIKMKALAMAEELDWSSSIHSSSANNQSGRLMVIFRFIRWRGRHTHDDYDYKSESKHEGRR